jgi:hypothetical protein
MVRISSWGSPQTHLNKGHMVFETLEVISKI